MKLKTNNQKGQVILILLLIMTIALAIGLSVVQRSLSDVSTSSKVEQSSRAFSAAEAGVERAINTGSSSFDVSQNELQNLSNAEVRGVDIPDSTIKAFEIPPFTKEEIAQVWLQGGSYPSGLDIYWGKANSSDKPALEVTFIYNGPTGYASQKYFFDYDSTRTATNYFQSPINCGATNLLVSHLTPAPGRNYFCRQNVAVPNNSILLRARLLYSDLNEHPFAADPLNGFLPSQQTKLITSEGFAGETRRKIRLFKQDNVVPFLFDYVIFSVGSITKL